MNQTILQLAKKYSKDSIIKRMSESYANAQLKIGFVGMFSAGKTTLINSLLGTHLPVDINPTTKSICVIEATEGIAKNEYYLEENGVRKESNFTDFENRVSGGSEGVAVVKVPATAEMPDGVIFVDTPGVDNFSSAEAELSYKYLALLDAAVVCIDVNEGTLRANVGKFISGTQLAALSKRMIFALTHADTKSADKVEVVRKEVISQLQKLASKSKLSLDNIEDRIIAVNGTDAESAHSVIKLISSKILAAREAIVAERILNDEKKLAEELRLLLKDDLENMTYDTTKLNRKKAELNSELDKLQELLKKRKRGLEMLGDRLQEQIFSILNSHELELTNAPSNERYQAIFAIISEEISTVTKDLCKTYAGDIAVPAVNLGSLGGDLKQTLERIKNIRDFSVMAGTALITAGAGAGTTAAANAAEAAAGAIIQKAGKAADTASKAAKAADAASKAAKAVDAASKASKVVDAASKATKAVDAASKAGKVVDAASKAGKVVKKAAEEAEKKTEGTFTKILRGTAKILHDINPLECAGDWLASELKHKSFAEIVHSKSILIADSIVEQLDEPYEQLVLIPIRERINEQTAAIDQLLEERANGLKDYQNRREELKSDIASLEQVI